MAEPEELSEQFIRARVYGVFATLMLRGMAEEEMEPVLQMLAHIAEAQGRDLNVGTFAAAKASEEFEQLFLVPLPGRDVSLYGSAYRAEGSEAWSEASFQGAGLAAACGIDWQPDAFQPGQAYLIDPDHLGLWLALLAEVIERQADGRDEALAGKSPTEWERWLRADLLSWLPILTAKLHEEPEAVLYPQVLELLLGYLRLDDELSHRVQ